MPITFSSSCLFAGASLFVSSLIPAPSCTKASCLYYSFSSNMPFESRHTHTDSMLAERERQRKKGICRDNHNSTLARSCVAGRFNLGQKKKNQPLIIAGIVTDNLSAYLRRRSLHSRIDREKIITISIDGNALLFIQDILVRHAHAHVSKLDLLRR